MALAIVKQEEAIIPTATSRIKSVIATRMVLGQSTESRDSTVERQRSQIVWRSDLRLL